MKIDPDKLADLAEKLGECPGVTAPERVAPDPAYKAARKIDDYMRAKGINTDAAAIGAVVDIIRRAYV